MKKTEIRCMRGHLLGMIYIYQRKGNDLGHILNYEASCRKCDIIARKYAMTEES